MCISGGIFWPILRTGISLQDTIESQDNPDKSTQNYVKNHKNLDKDIEELENDSADEYDRTGDGDVLDTGIALTKKEAKDLWDA